MSKDDPAYIRGYRKQAEYPEGTYERGLLLDGAKEEREAVVRFLRQREAFHYKYAYGMGIVSVGEKSSAAHAYLEVKEAADRIEAGEYLEGDDE